MIGTRQCRYGLLSYFETDTIIGKAIECYGEWAQGEIDLLARFLKPGDQVLDVGANIGTHTLAFAELVGTGGRVLAFEPQMAIFEVLKRNLQQNGLSQVNAFNQGVDQEPGSLSVPSMDYAVASSFGAVALSTSGDAPGMAQVDCIPLDSLGLDACALIKIDVEGMEERVLRGACALLGTLRPIVYSECNEAESGWQVASLMQTLGYRSYLHRSPAFNPANYAHSDHNLFGLAHETNLLFIPQEHVALLSPLFDPSDLTPIGDRADLVKAMADTPRWGDPALAELSRLGLYAHIGRLNEHCHALEAETLEASQALGETLHLLPPAGPLAEVVKAVGERVAQLEKRVLDLTTTLTMLDTRLKVADDRSQQLLTAKGVLTTGARYLVRKLRAAWQTPPAPKLLEGFDRDFYLAAYPDVATAKVNPLQHYLEGGAYEGRDPNDWFNSRFYLRACPDVAEAGLNPLDHYMRHGRSEGRRPNPLHVSGEDLGEIARLAQATKGRPVILLISHIGGGGTEKHLRDLQERVGAQACFLLLAPANHHLYGVSLKGKLRLSPLENPAAEGLFFDPATQQAALVAILRELGVARVHLHHMLGHEAHLESLMGAIALPYDLTLHDYYLLSPHPHLVGPGGTFSGEPEDDRLTLGLDPAQAAMTCGEWRTRVGWVLERADRIIAPSHDVKQRFERHCARRDIRVVPHPEPPRASLGPDPRPIAPEAPLRIAVLGELSPQKGAELVQGCALEAHRRGLPLEFHLIGSPWAPMIEAPRSQLTVHGPYEDRDLPARLASLAPHLIWFPARCPESYSYTLSAALRANLPVAVPSLGAFAERVAGRPWSWVFDWAMEPQAACAALLDVRQAFLSGDGPPLTGPAPHTEDDFYDQDYLRPLRSAIPAQGP